MDFLHSQITLSTIDWILRAIIAFFLLLVIAKLLGQRSLSQLRVLDFAITLVIGNIIAQPLSDERLGLEGSIITTLVLLILYLSSLFISLKFPFIRRLINHSPITIIQNGEILYKELTKSRISIDVLEEGKINFNDLKKLNKNEDWVVSKLKNLYQTEVKNVLLATLDNKDNLKVFLYK